MEDQADRSSRLRSKLGGYLGRPVLAVLVVSTLLIIDMFAVI
jgi:hypothetical protein